ncbi:hypothetical protein HZS_1736 [Henneguya salminicola]|nr:hypothetical protein HZS_1736 [Henneguya salminicola]
MAHLSRDYALSHRAVCPLIIWEKFFILKYPFSLCILNVHFCKKLHKVCKNEDRALALTGDWTYKVAKYEKPIKYKCIIEGKNIPAFLFKSGYFVVLVTRNASERDRIKKCFNDIFHKYHINRIKRISNGIEI